MRMGNAQINTNPCTQAEQNANWSVLNNFLTNFVALANADHKVALDAADEAGVHADFLDVKLYYAAADGDLGTYPGFGVPVVANINGTQEELRADFTQVTGAEGDPEGDYVLGLNGGQLNWQAAPGITETNKVKSSAIDPTADYLHTAFTLNATWSEPADLLVAVQTVDGGAGNLKEKPFVDVSIIPGFHLTAFRVWTTENNTTTLISAADFGTAFFSGITIDGGSYSGGVLTIDGGGGSGTAKFGKADSNIAARTTTTVPKGTVSIWTIDGSDVMSDTGDNETWYNLSTTGLVRAGDIIQAKLDATSGKMIIDFEDCTLSDL